MSFMNQEINEEYAETMLPPTIQWRRGDLINQNELLKNGCWQLPAEQWADMFPDQAPIQVVHGGGVIVPSYLMARLNFAILTHKKFWFIEENERNIILKPGEFREGAKSKFLIFVIVKELKSPAIITTSGLNSKHLQASVQNFVNIVV